MRRNHVVLFLLMTALIPAADADFYRWTDTEGNVHVTTTPPPKKGKKSKVKVIESEHKKPARSTAPKKILHDAGFLTGPGSVYKPAVSASAPAAKPAVKALPTVELYGAPWCPSCVKAKAYLQEKGIAFTDYNVDTDQAASARLKSYNPKGSIPVTIIGGQVLVGFSASSFDAALKQP